MLTEIVIARYNEKLDWLKKLPKNIKITIYNKGLSDIDYPFISLPNVGRESNTYLHHIIKNYNNLADLTIFCQGDTLFHSPNFIKLVKNRKTFEPIQPLSSWYWPEGESPYYYSNPPLTNKNKVHVEYMDSEFITKYPNYYLEPYFIRLVNTVKDIYKVDNLLEFNIKKLHLKNINKNTLFPVCYAGIFAVKKNVILENSIDFYSNINNILLNEKRFDYGLFLEKLWLVIFNYKKNNKNYIELKSKKYKHKTYNLKIINNEIKFKLKLVFYQLYLDLFIDKDKYYIFIDRAVSFIKKNNNLVYKKKYEYKSKISNLLNKNGEYITFIKLVNGKLMLAINNTIIINYNVEGNIEKASIDYVTSFSFID